MTETTVTPARATNPAFKGLGLIFKGLAFAVLAPMYPFAPRYMRHAMRTMGTMGTRIDLQMRADAVRHMSSEDTVLQEELFEDLRAFVAADNWAGLSDRLAELDRARARLTRSDHRLTDLALDFLPRVGVGFLDCFVDRLGRAAVGQAVLGQALLGGLVGQGFGE